MKLLNLLIIGLYMLPGFIHAHAKSGLVNLREVVPSAEFDIRYATQNNFLKQQVYPKPFCYVLNEVALRLALIQAELQKEGLGLKFFDGYRPMAAQQKMWDLIQDERYVLNPKNGGGRHTRGTTIDLTLVDRFGNELPMGTEFDDFSEKAWFTYANLPKDVLANRQKLRAIMERHGFAGIKCEWWHYDLVSWQGYPVLDVDPNELV